MQYVYYARDLQGRSVRGRTTAPSTHAVIEHLRSRSLTAVDVRHESRVRQALQPLRNASHGTAMIVALRTLGTLLGVGLPMRRALNIVVQATRYSALREGFSAVLASVECGASLGTAMQNRSDLFTPMTTALVHAGERGGVLVETLERHATNLEQQQMLKRKLMTGMIYPAVVLCTALGLIIFLMTSVLPMFAALFDQLHVDQPWILRVLIGIPALFSARNVLIAVCAAAAVIVSVRSLLRIPDVEARLATYPRVRIPIIGELREKASTARFSRALATLLKAGVSLPEALLCVRPVLGIKRFMVAADRIGDALRDGNSLAGAIEAQRLFDPLLIHLVRIGEETGTLDVQLQRLAEWFEHEFSEATTRAAALLEPLLIVGIGGVVGTIVFSVFVPLYTLIGGIR